MMRMGSWYQLQQCSKCCGLLGLLSGCLCGVGTKSLNKNGKKKSARGPPPVRISSPGGRVGIMQACPPSIGRLKFTTVLMEESIDAHKHSSHHGVIASHDSICSLGRKLTQDKMQLIRCYQHKDVRVHAV